MPTKKSHHHGNLRAALIQAGIDLIAEGGAEALSIRQAAARAGVSHAAPAHHFPSLAHLRGAIVTEGFRRFTQAMEDEIARSPDTPHGHLVGAGRGYQRFAREHPGLFMMMFGSHWADDSAIDTELEQASAESYGVLRRVCAPIAPGPAGSDGNELFIWALAHGLASLTAVGQGTDLVPGTDEERFEAVLPALRFRKRSRTDGGR
ncbi:MAG: TetR/AcrR family transcriptional regulator [Burkholderiaceae bacterium]